MNNHARNYKVPKPIMPEKQFLDKHPRPLVTVDIVIISESKDYLDVLLIQRKNHPFSNFWALPGGFILKDESPYQAADRKLKSETNLAQIPLYPIGVFGEPCRDPRGWVISFAFCAVVKANSVTPFAGDDAAKAKWFRLKWKNKKDFLSIFITHNEQTLSAKLKLKQKDTSLGITVRFELIENNNIAFDHAKILATALHLIEQKKILNGENDYDKRTGNFRNSNKI